jgi:hypothetical protein
LTIDVSEAVMSTSPRNLLLLVTTGVLAFSSAALPAAEPGVATGARKAYMDERARCMSIADAEDRKTCLREAGAALDEAKRGRLGEGEAGFEQNKFARCAVHKNAEDRDFCERRMKGEGTTTGSVEGGGILRELRVVVPADEPAGAKTR